MRVAAAAGWRRAPGQVVGHPAEPGQRAQLHAQPEPAVGSPVRLVRPPQVLARGAEKGDQVGVSDLRRPSGQPGQLGSEGNLVGTAASPHSRRGETADTVLHCAGRPPYGE